MPEPKRLVLALLLLVVVAGCRRGQNIGPTLQPTLTPTPRSTPLPTLEPTVPPGSEDNPIRLAFVTPANLTRGALNRAVTEIEQALQDTTDLIITLLPTASDAEALAALCGSFSGPPTAAFLSGLGYAAASAQGCGAATLWVTRDRAGTETVQIILPDESEVPSAAGLVGADFCRLSLEDQYTWLLPSLILRAGGVTPDELRSISDMETIDALVEAVAAGECDAAGLTAAQFEESAAGAVRTAIRTLNETVEVPISVLVYPLEVPLGARTAVNEALLDLAAGRGDALETLLRGDDLARADEDTLLAFEDFVRSAGLDFAVIGQ